ncbi:MAG: FHA domain-containing protein [Deltaproteobacteria bacterium]|nr:FHA domain-containing protein [Deltaproteobacteria bacterium]
MSNDKNRDFQEGGGKDDFPAESSTRARNRTVMLTPEITGQVRARLAQEMEGGNEYPNAPQRPDPVIPSGRGSGGFSTPTAEPSGMYTPAGRAPQIEAPPVREAPRPQFGSHNIVWVKETPIVGFLVSYDTNVNGDVYELRSGRLIVSSEPASGGSYMVVDDSSVSPMHAILRISTTGEVQVLDQLSEFGTHIRRFGVEEEEHISGEKSTIEHGDIIKFGNRTFHVCILALES